MRHPTPARFRPHAGRRRFLQGSVAVALTLPALTRRARAEDTVNVYNWDTYIGEDTLAEFTEATGTEVRYDLFSGNDELFAKLREGNPGYDVIFPANANLQRMIKAGMVQKLDHKRVPNMANLEPRFLAASFDPGRTHSLPYFWGTFGLGYRKSAAEPTSWRDVFESDRYRGRVSLLTDFTVVQLALKYLGHSVNTTDPKEVDEAVDLLIRQKPNLQSFAPDTGQDLLIGGEVDLCLEFNGDILQVMAEDDDLSYVVPKEGTLVWEDTMAIPTGAPNVENAHAFIDHILTPEVHAAIAREIRYACPNAAAKALLPKEDLDNPALYPPEDVLARSETTLYRDETTTALYADGMTRVMAG